MVGVTRLVGILAVDSTHLTILGTVAFGYAFGSALIVGPLLQEGKTVGTVVMDALYSETPSIAVMRIAAIGTGVLLAGGGTIGEPLF